MNRTVSDTLLLLAGAGAHLTDTALSGQSSALLRSLSAADWNTLVQSARLHRVPALAVDGLQLILRDNPGLETEISSPENSAMLRRWYTATVLAERGYLAARKAAGTLAQFYASQNIPMMLLKGCGLAALYPEPSHRTFSDIDIYLFGKARFADSLLSDFKGITIRTDSDKHSKFLIGQIPVENHHTFFNIEKQPELAPVQQYLEQQASQSVKCPDGYFLPTVQMNAVLLPYHSATHYVFGSQSLAHLVDWALFLKRNAATVDWDSVLRLASVTGTTAFYGAINNIAVRRFGISPDALPRIQISSTFVSGVESNMLRYNPAPDAAAGFVRRTVHLAACRGRYSSVFNGNYAALMLRRARKNRTKETQQ